MARKTRRFKLLGVIMIGGMLMTGSGGCVSGQTYKEVIDTSIKTVASTLLDIIVINNLQTAANTN